MMTFKTQSTKLCRIIFLVQILLFVSLQLQSQEKCKEPPPGPNEGPHGCPPSAMLPKPPPPEGNIIVPVLHAFDPNDIVGPIGYEEPRWLSVDNNMSYMVRFENDPDFATAPAQIVTIELPIDEHMNPFSFRLGEFGFGDFRYSVPNNTSYYSETITNTVDSLGVIVDVTAGIDVVNNKAFWIFESKDPLTGLPPDDALLGFLPVNDTTVTIYTDTVTQRGEGFVNFSIEPLSTAMTGDTVQAQAAIVFDINAPIITNLWTNILDAFAPTSIMNSLPVYTPETTVELSWSDQDDPGGVGVANYDLFVSQNGEPFYLLAAELMTTTYSFTGEEGSTYSFYTRATDHVGNEEQPKSAGEASIQLGGEGPSISITHPVAGQAFCLGDTVAIDWITNLVNEVDLLISADGGSTYDLLAEAVDSMSSPFQWIIPTNGNSSPNYVIQVVQSTENGISTISQAFTINGLPIVTLGNDTMIVEGSNLVLDAGNSGFEYLWSTGETTQTITVMEANDYSVTVTDPNGCSSSDAINVTVITSTEELAGLAAFNIFPNPARDQLNISYYLKSSAIVSIEIRNLLGQTLFRQPAGQNVRGNQLHTIDLADWVNGPYLLLINFGEYTVEKRFIKA